MNTENQGTTSTAKSVSAKAALEMLHSGKTRKEINDSFGLSAAEGRLLWQHPSLKGRKYVAPVNLTIVDDIPEKEPKAPVAETASPAIPASPEVPTAETEEIPAATEEKSRWDR